MEEYSDKEIDKKIEELESSDDSSKEVPTVSPLKEEKKDEDDKPDYLKEEDVIETFDEDMCEVEEFAP